MKDVSALQILTILTILPKILASFADEMECGVR